MSESVKPGVRSRRTRQGLRHQYHLFSYRVGADGDLSAVKDFASREMVAFEVTTSLTMEIVYRTLKKLEEALDGNIHGEAMIHSDRGFH